MAAFLKPSLISNRCIAALTIISGITTGASTSTTANSTVASTPGHLSKPVHTEQELTITSMTHSGCGGGRLPTGELLEVHGVIVGERVKVRFQARIAPTRLDSPRTVEMLAVITPSLVFFYAYPHNPSDLSH